MNYISDKRFQAPAIPAKCVFISSHGRHVYRRRRRIHSRVTTLLLAALILLYGVLFVSLKTVADGGQVPVSFEPVEYKETGLSYLSAQTVTILPALDPEQPIEVVLETTPIATPEISGVVEEPERWYTNWEWEITAIIIYQEAGGDACSDDTRYKVGEVFWNRVASPDFPNTAEEVATDEAQYGTLHWTGIKWPDRAQLPGEAHAVERAWEIARQVLEGERTMPEDTIWQAEFPQGSEIVAHQDGIYFCR